MVLKVEPQLFCHRRELTSVRSPGHAQHVSHSLHAGGRRLVVVRLWRRGIGCGSPTNAFIWYAVPLVSFS